VQRTESVAALRGASLAQATPSKPVHVVHVIQHLQTGGLENGLVNLINGLSTPALRHSIVCLNDYSDFRTRITARPVEVIAIRKRPGKDPAHYSRLYRALRRLQPTVVHTRNVGALDSILVARLAGAPFCVHGEHGWDMHDLDGTSPRYRRYRKLLRPFVSRYVAVTRDIERWLVQAIGIAPHRIAQICNGVDTSVFSPVGRDAGLRRALGWHDSLVVIGTVGRLKSVKNQVLLVRAFARLLASDAALRERLRLLIVGSGPDQAMLAAEAAAGGVGALCHFAGERSDVAHVMREIDVFVLPSLNEGLSNTILEAMATARPVVASAVGGNPELLAEAEPGALFPVNDDAALAQVLGRYATDTSLRRDQGLAARNTVERRFSLATMMQQYEHLYFELTGAAQPHGLRVS
jgi:sugar transferase (PEP-CTERM/EpsH1 system associated)